MTTQTKGTKNTI